MIGPIFHHEVMLGGRRNRLYVFRWIYAGLLILQIGYLYLAFQQEQSQRWFARQFMNDLSTPVVVSPVHVVAGRFTELFVWQQLLFLVLVVPTLVAGAITDEKRSGTLLYLLSAGVDTREILLGKLLGRMAQVVLVALTGAPLFALLGAFAGIDLLTMLILAVELTMALFALASAALLSSVLCRQTRDAVLSLYLVGGLAWMATQWVGGSLNLFNPLYVISPVWEQALHPNWQMILGRLFGSIAAWGALGGVCLALAMWQLRPTFRRELESSSPYKAASGKERFPGEGDPILWREQNIEGLSPFRFLRAIPQWLAVCLIMLATTASSLLILNNALPAQATLPTMARAILQMDAAQLGNLIPDASVGFLVQSIVVLLLASFIVGIRCSGAVSGERERQSWEAMLLTPVSAKQLVHGKLWGVLHASFVYLLAYGSLAVVLSTFGGLLALCWTVLWLAVTCLAMYYVGAAGIWCSVKSKNSWRALLGTIGIGYLGGLALYIVISPAILLLAGLFIILTSLADLIFKTQVTGVAAAGISSSWNLFFAASCVGLALIFYLMSRFFLNWAQRYIADRERTRHWQDNHLFRRPRRLAEEKQLTLNE